MADFSEIELDIDGPVATIAFDRPDALNAITPTMLGELNDAADRVATDVAVRAVVVTGRGRAFSAGVDLKALGERQLSNGKVGDILDVPARALTATLSSMPKPVVAAVNGFCFTGALEIALACDIMLVADEAKIADTHAKFGIRPTWGMTQRLPDAVGITRARELSYTARTIGGREAVEIGLAARSAPRDTFADALATLLDELLANSSDAFGAYKDLYRERLPLDAGLTREYGTDYPFDDSDTAARLADFR
ncbi:enoyl-CoA hydratase/isomerase family protein [Ilumatobacter coccineus]|uniref:Putative enoyl-CoA hydratase n=1 Tax=Ilumatobacter coccineus (strain NBRC 103263 / KCTC 29153 / YM16-304) TaxID=1313172 RepID=A0A6C7DYM8_ILUCY|nr:enoyl-CoA hydratase/isomerase family protein [Ilumatobacter coccineus]BAN00397.1 putative enoyl-CoA hydratase [Ilumatobacter coccineus YM16-304]